MERSKAMAIDRIVIVDESDANILFFEVVLKDLGFKDVQVGRGGNHAIEVMKKNHSQFAIVAWEMTAMPGTIFVQKARQELRKRHLPYLIYSKRLT
jgi:CheY-like chemotaxis protein